jgi:dUTP pyrophosphatase
MLKFKLHSTNAVAPTKASPEESGYDLTAVSFVKRLGPHTFMYDTEVSVEPPSGYYTEIVARSSIVKTGWMLSNNVGIIDSSYRGTLKIVLTDVDTKGKTFYNFYSNGHIDFAEGRPMTCPFTLTQLIVRKRHNFDVEIVSDLSSTSRGGGGFGSTGANGGNSKV